MLRRMGEDYRADTPQEWLTPSNLRTTFGSTIQKDQAPESFPSCCFCISIAITNKQTGEVRYLLTEDFI